MTIISQRKKTVSDRGCCVEQLIEVPEKLKAIITLLVGFRLNRFQRS